MSASAPWTLRELDAAGAAETWRSVSRFVTWLVHRYELAELVPVCWWQHGAFVEELTALWASWTAAYLDPEAPADAPLMWHERFAACRLRIGEWDRLTCAQRGHRDAPPLEWQVDEEAYASFVTEDLVARPGQHRLALLGQRDEPERGDPEDDPPC